MKVAPIIEAARRREGIEIGLVHTGQHYDAAMSSLFFEELGLPRPDVYLNVGSGTHAVQTAKVMLGFEPVVLDWKPDVVLVVGDVNSTLACALVAAKLGVGVAHVEAGLRSFDPEMPEEINRVLTDRISDYLLIPSWDARENLLSEGLPPSRIFFAGNVMVDTLKRHEAAARQRPVLAELGMSPGDYAVLTLHRPSNVDRAETLGPLLGAVQDVQRRLPVVFPIHPRTRAAIERFGWTDRIGRMENLILTEPRGYLDCLALVSQARVVLTDSGGIQEETTVLGVPCLTLRHNTERPVTITHGTNRLVGQDAARIVAVLDDVLAQGMGAACVPEGWDGRAAERILDVLTGHPLAQLRGAEAVGSARLAPARADLQEPVPGRDLVGTKDQH
jgi:UDP-N-acetylglucosamine 2-epimerase (non-hydrolysing)